MTAPPSDQLEELTLVCASATVFEEAGQQFVMLPKLRLPPGCVPPESDAILCPTARDGYPSRLYFSEQIRSPTSRNWNGAAHLAGRNWVAISWKIEVAGVRLAQLLALHLDALR